MCLFAVPDSVCCLVLPFIFNLGSSSSNESVLIFQINTFFVSILDTTLFETLVEALDELHLLLQIDKLVECLYDHTS